MKIPNKYFIIILLNSLLWGLLILALNGCKKEDAPAQVPTKLELLKNYAEFYIVADYLNSFDKTTGTYDLNDRGLSFISLRKQEAYKFYGGEALSRQADIDFVYEVSESGRTGYFRNTGWYKPSDNGFAKSPFGPYWTEWNDISVLAWAHTTNADPVTGSLYSLSDEEFDSIKNNYGFGVVNFGDNVSALLDDSQKLKGTATFDIWQDGNVDDNYYFAFTLKNDFGRGVFKLSKETSSTALRIHVKMAY